MADVQKGKPILQKPPGYKDPTVPVQRNPRAPPRKLVLPPSFHQKKQRMSFRRICCCSFCILTLLLVTIISISFAVFYLWFDPKLPVFHLQSFSFRFFNVSVKTDGTYLNVATLTRVEARNPNEKLTYYYGVSEVEVSAGKDKEIEFGSKNLAGFTQAKHSMTSLKIETKNNQLVEDGAGTRLMSRYKNKDMVVNVDIRTRVGVGWKGWKIRPLNLGVNVICGGVTLKTLNGEMPKCTINLLKWINIH
ncbi:NDR1/HIN1-like protein 13 [Mangifera indica]|uniref:NDR1/HIN1-like protein 13 n=1 Tax=Mangifera indica TaxID=29780 RepID=UPI001CFA5C5C|nr:NDR1/HIN1-like protein 13 [Mangifera indica]